jgi:predicted nucleic acid-binding protein
MTTAIDTNILVCLINSADPLNKAVERTLDTFSTERLMICGAVYAELLAFRGRTESVLDGFLLDTRIDVDWSISESVWRSAGQAFSKYAARRRKNTSGHPRRILTDFIIGAHATGNGYSLLTLDDKIFRPAFPKLKLLTI